MEHFRSPGFIRALEKFSSEIRTAFEKQLRFLLSDIRHPSLRAKKYDEDAGIWQARVTRNVRFYFGVDGDTYILLDIEKHPD